MRKKLFRSIRSKLILSFTLFFIITCVVAGTTFWFNSVKERIENITTALNAVNFKIQEIGALEKEFLIDETINPEFYATKKSNYLDQHHTLLKEVRFDLEKLKNAKDLQELDIQDEISQLTSKLDSFELTFDQFVEVIYYRGFKDYGVEGEMRRYIHQIEQLKAKFDMVKLLMIRRHEKDFILRKEERYIQKLSESIEELRKDIHQNIKNNDAIQEIDNLLDNYQSAFFKLVKAEETIGFDNKHGIRGALIKQTNDIEKLIRIVNSDVISQSKKIETRVNWVMAIVVVMAIVINIVLGVFITNVLSRPVQALSKSIYKVIQSNFDEKESIAPIDSNDEIGRLHKDFTFMVKKVRESIQVISEQKAKVEESQEQLTASIRYAKTIQEAILPQEDEFQQHFLDHFIIYQPQYLVSGDFYWLAKKKGTVFIVVADCTGHGVPGAFMSMIGNDLLNKIIIEQKIYEPALILEALDIEIEEALQQQKSKNKDGMDVALCAIKRHENNHDCFDLLFTAAKRSIFVLRGGEFTELKGNKRMVGGGFHTEKLPFEVHHISLNSGDLIYMFSDGLPDQNNAARQKFGMKRLTELILSIYKEPLSMQRDIIIEELRAHQGNEPQRDDITMIGIKI